MKHADLARNDTFLKGFILSYIVDSGFHQINVENGANNHELVVICSELLGEFAYYAHSFATARPRMSASFGSYQSARIPRL